MSSLRHRFGTRIRELRLAQGLSQEAFADKCGFARTYMSRIETGGANPSLDALQTLATALGLSLSDLFQHIGSAQVLPRDKPGGGEENHTRNNNNSAGSDDTAAPCISKLE